MNRIETSTTQRGESRAQIEQLRAGNEKAFGDLVRHTTPRLLMVARRFLRNDEEARDVVQETFVSAFRAIGSFRSGSRIETWLHRIAVNHCLMRLRSRRRKPEQSIEDVSGNHVQSSTEETPFRVLQSKEVSELLQSAIERLPESLGSVVRLRDLEELGTSETAALLGISTSATKVRLHRGRQALREILERHRVLSWRFPLDGSIDRRSAEA